MKVLFFGACSLLTGPGGRGGTGARKPLPDR